MSKRKAYVPMTEVIGAHPILDDSGCPVMKGGKHVFRMPNPQTRVMHFRNEAARRRCGGDLRAATPNDVRLVPIYRGAPASLMTYYRAMKRRD